MGMHSAGASSLCSPRRCDFARGLGQHCETKIYLILNNKQTKADGRKDRQREREEKTQSRSGRIQQVFYSPFITAKINMNGYPSVLPYPARETDGEHVLPANINKCTRMAALVTHRSRPGGQPGRGGDPTDLATPTRGKTKARKSPGTGHPTAHTGESVVCARNDVDVAAAATAAAKQL